MIVFGEFLSRLSMEPPFRIAARALLKRLNPSAETRMLWDLSERSAYLMGVLAAAHQAAKQQVQEISVVEFGVAGGSGLVVLQEEAAVVEEETGIGIRVYGFDMGADGLPPFIGDHRDHPDAWRPGDFPMDEAALRARLAPRTNLVLGNIRETVQSFFAQYDPPPIGFASIDVDLYSSARDALKILSAADKRMLWHVPLYFDDIEFMFNHRFAGELLAIEEFNQQNELVKIDRWYGVRSGRPFPERPFLDRMYVAHDLCAATDGARRRDPVRLDLGSSD